MKRTGGPHTARPAANKARFFPAAAATNILDRLQEFYEKGAQSNLSRERWSRSDIDTADSNSSKGQLELLRKSRQFASCYTPKQFRDLISQCKKHGHPLGLSHLIRLITVKPLSARNALQLEAIEGGWSRGRLDAEILKRVGNRRPLAGRPRRAPVDAQETYYLIGKACEGWSRLWRSLLSGASPEGGEASLRADLSKPIATDLVEANQAIDRLSQNIQRRLKHPPDARPYPVAKQPRKTGTR